MITGIRWMVRIDLFDIAVYYMYVGAYLLTSQYMNFIHRMYDVSGPCPLTLCMITGIRWMVRIDLFDIAVYCMYVGAYLLTSQYELYSSHVRCIRALSSHVVHEYWYMLDGEN